MHIFPPQRYVSSPTIRQVVKRASYQVAATPFSGLTSTGGPVRSRVSRMRTFQMLEAEHIKECYTITCQVMLQLVTLDLLYIRDKTSLAILNGQHTCCWSRRSPASRRKLLSRYICSRPK